MLDWPEASQTSPTHTSPNRSRFDPSIVSSKGPPAVNAGSAIFQRPVASATVDADCAANATRIDSPAAAVPHSRTGRPR